MMRLDDSMTSLALPLLLFCFYGPMQGENSCELDIHLKRKTSWTAFTMETLAINCTIIDCGTETELSWCKLDNITGCQTITETELIQMELRRKDTNQGLYFLHFTNVSVNDTGSYRCRTTGNVSLVSQSIEVFIKDGPEQESIPPEWLPYIYISLGILVLIVTVIVTFCLLRSKGSKRSTEAKRLQTQVRMYPQSSVPLNKDEVPQISPCPKLPDRPRSIRSHHTQVPPAWSSCVYHCPCQEIILPKAHSC
ncbi:hypothetical protein AAFF_G00368100 [Aldrovandia affinis]|uniref:Ig-like domain-containing protein n=1 Tax=Aldrovandia affinis TaxID=143900 RepID=A0AAD7R578_9TELE|nr:hypothetical protein AAFF_G00368100 [Aldrovandia affinis]